MNDFLRLLDSFFKEITPKIVKTTLHCCNIDLNDKKLYL